MNDAVANREPVGGGTEPTGESRGDLRAALFGSLQAGCAEVTAQAAAVTVRPAEAIHELRRGLRRLRALLRMLPAAWPGDLAWQADRALGAARRALAHARDADVLPSAVDRLPAKTQRTMQAIIAHLQHKRAFVLADPLWPEVAAAAAARTQTVTEALIDQLGEVDEAMCARGLGKLLRRLEAAKRRCERKASHRRIHALRKSAKYLADALWWLGSAHGAEHKALSKAVDHLGRATDVLVLHAWLQATGAGRRLGVRRRQVRAADVFVLDSLAQALAQLDKIGPCDADAGLRLGARAADGRVALRGLAEVG
ncbi:MAG: CHAD domain-containing protein [Deltaproteobacteria bacterium]|nr:CHAD domain-containing protein [Deltaproteobacteria bacterium]